MNMLTESQRKANLHPSRYVILAAAPLPCPLQPVDSEDPRARIPQNPPASGPTSVPDSLSFLRERK